MSKAPDAPVRAPPHGRFHHRAIAARQIPAVKDDEVTRGRGYEESLVGAAKLAAEVEVGTAGEDDAPAGREAGSNRGRHVSLSEPPSRQRITPTQPYGRPSTAGADQRPPPAALKAFAARSTAHAS
jgi:hypothetical protein